MKRILLVVTLFGLIGCWGKSSAEPLRQKPAHGAPASEAMASAPMLRTGPLKDHALGAPQQFDELSIFPIFAEQDVAVGPMTTLERSIAAGKAEVREVGSEGGSSRSRVLHRNAHRRDEFDDDSAQVNKLVIENKGDVPIYVLAGTVVKGGNQDRQIGQDFVIDAHRTVDVDAFCVEQGRWTGERNGHATSGKFGAMQQLVPGSARAAAQYEQNQGEVWAQVAKVNATHKKSAASGTLLATLDDRDFESKRAALATSVQRFLASAEPSQKLVGFAFAIDGQVKSVRWFASHSVFDLFRSTLVNAAAVDALTARAAQGPNKSAQPAPKSETIVDFMTAVESAPSEERNTAAANSNHYKRGDSGYGSKTYRKSAASVAAPAAAVPLSVDYLAK